MKKQLINKLVAEATSEQDVSQSDDYFTPPVNIPALNRIGTAVYPDPKYVNWKKLFLVVYPLIALANTIIVVAIVATNVFIMGAKDDDIFQIVVVFGSMALMVTVALSIYYTVNMTDKIALTFKKTYEKVLNDNFKAFKTWLEDTYDVEISSTNTINSIQQLKENVAFQASNNISTVVTTGNELFTFVSNKDEKRIYLLDRTGNIQTSEVCAQETTVVLNDEATEIWDSISSKLATLRKRSLSAEENHTVARVETDRKTIKETVSQIIELNAEPHWDEVTETLQTYDTELQDIIDEQVSNLQHKIELAWVMSLGRAQQKTVS